MNNLYFGDNLDVLREKIKDESVDLIYLDPPFNSSLNFNVLFKETAGNPSEAQAEAFRDTWFWGTSAEEAYTDIVESGSELAILMHALRAWFGDNAMMAYLAMMAVRLSELRRVLKPTGSIYLHCDPTASHYLKMILDAIFGNQCFRNEIVWKRTPFAGSSKSRAKQLPRSHDNILFFSNDEDWYWDPPTNPYSEKYLSRFKWDDKDGRGPYRKTLLKTYSQSTYDRLGRDGRLIMPIKVGAKPSYKQYLRESRGQTQIDDVWMDINALNPVARERLGYPTQKPVALLERIISQSSKEGDVVLDPFCGCGTTIEASEKLKRRWIGVDITHYAVTLIERRIKKEYPDAEYKVYGRPTKLPEAVELARRDKYQFQWWAAWLLGAQTYESKKGADRGIDGNIFFPNGPFGLGRIIISVKGGDNVGPSMVRELLGVVVREKAEMGILITLISPTKAMVADAVGSGFVENSAHGRLPIIQVATIAELLSGKMPRMPPIPTGVQQTNAEMKKRNRDQLEMLFSLPNEIAANKDTIVDPRFMKIA